MKRRTKGILAFVFLGGIMITSGFLAAIPKSGPEVENPEITITGTPADNFPDVQRAQFCGSSIAKSTDYVQEYSIPTPCTNPLAIVTDYDGNVWFAQTNTGKVAKFDPITKTFSEYDNPSWPKGARSMMWGIDYAPDGSVWYTDEAFDSVWKFSTIEEKYERLGYPSEEDSLPQRILVDGSQIIINDFTGNKLTLLNPTQSSEEVNYISIPSPVDNSVTAGFAVDASDNIWYTNWLFQQGGVLVKFNQTDYLDTVASSGEQFLGLLDFIQIYQLPPELLTPNGAAVGNDGTIWLADTTSSSFFNFDPLTEQFTQYVTAEPILSTYGNQTGIVKTPISRPYWIETDDQGRIVFNGQTANTISVMDPKSQSLVEYQIPSKNPYWGDCDPGTGMMIADCGLAQIFDFTVDGEKIWFTEWVENNIGVVDTSIKLPLNVETKQREISIKTGESTDLGFVIQSQSETSLSDISPIISKTNQLLSISSSVPKKIALNPNESMTIDATISADKNIMPGTYKILVGAQMPDVSVSEFITLIIQP